MKALTKDVLRGIFADKFDSFGFDNLAQTLWDAGFRTEEGQSFDKFFKVDLKGMLRELGEENVIYWDEGYGEIRPPA